MSLLCDANTAHGLWRGKSDADRPAGSPAPIVRAAAVKAYVVSTFAMAQDRLTTAGFGDTTPVGDNKTDAGRTQNRRVELVKK